MRQLSADAILLDVVDLHERDRIVRFLTAELGTKRGVARGARTKFSRFAGRLQPLARVRIEWFERDDHELVRIRDVALERPVRRLVTDLERLLVGSYLADHAGLFAPENEAAPRLFRLLEACLGALESGAEAGAVARYFEVWALRLAGVFPSAATCGSCGRSLRDSENAWLIEEELWCRECGRTHRMPEDGGEGETGPVRVSAAALGLLERMRRVGPEELVAGGPSPGGRSEPALLEIERLTATIRRHFLGDELRSYLVLKRTLAGA